MSDSEPDVPAIMMDLLAYFERCVECKKGAATQKATPSQVIIGEGPGLCDDCSGNERYVSWIKEDLAWAQTVRSANRYVDSHIVR